MILCSSMLTTMSMKMQDIEGSVQVQTRPCQSCNSALNWVHCHSFSSGSGSHAQKPMISSINLL